MQKHALVLGGAGFIGHHLTKALLKTHRVTVVDNFFTSNPSNVAEFDKNDYFSLIKADVRETLQTSEKVDVVFNLACPASPVHYQASPVFTLETAILGTKNALELAHEHQAILVQASTSEVYGDPLISPQVESYWGNVNSYGPRACYDEGKRAAEALIHSHMAEKGTDARIMRIFNTYGPNMAVNDGRVVSNFLVSALRSEPLVVQGDGLQTRSFCFVSDMVEGVLALANLNSNPGGPVNLGNPFETSILDLAQKVIEIAGQGEIHFADAAVDDPRTRKPSIARAEAILGWSPKVGLEAGVTATYEYFANKISGP